MLTSQTRKNTDNRSYSELMTIETFKDRYEYLRLHGKVGAVTFGFDRYLNQKFYHSAEWKRIRDYVIVRDNGCDLGSPDHPIRGKVYIHHMNPISVQDLRNSETSMLDPEYLICVSKETHDAIHYGDSSLLQEEWKERQPNDTCPWKQ